MGCSRDCYLALPSKSDKLVTSDSGFLVSSSGYHHHTYYIEGYVYTLLLVRFVRFRFGTTKWVRKFVSTLAARLVSLMKERNA